MRGKILIITCLLLAACRGEDETQIGKPCSDDDDCGSDGECLTELPDGMCSQTCDGDCPRDAICVDLAGQGYCFPGCNDRDDCRDGYTCSAGYCDIPCESDDECPEYSRCDADAESCVLRDDQPLGAACRENDQCQSGLCLNEGTSGNCTESCGGEPECSAEGLVCALVDQGGELQPLCRRPLGEGFAGDLCETGSDCASGNCSLGACTFPCSDDGECHSGAYCEIDPVDVDGANEAVDLEHCRLEAAVGVRVHDLGAIETVRGVVSLEFDIPEDIVSFAVVAWTDQEVLIKPRNLIGPEGQILIDYTGMGDIRVRDEIRATTVLVPNSDREEAAARPGRYSIEIYAQEADGYMLIDAVLHIRLLVKVREGGVCNDGEITLNFHMSNNFWGDLDVDSAPDSVFMRSVLNRVGFFYTDQCGIDVGDVRYFELDSTYSLVSSLIELYQMFERVSATAPVATVNVFIIRELTGDYLEWAAGIAGGIPGPPGLRGTPHSGVAMSTMDQWDAGMAGDTVAHEIGHYFGLYHTTEMNGILQDVIFDTAPCSFDPDNADEILACPSSNNIMFPTFVPEQDHITEGQCFVVRGFQGL